MLPSFTYASQGLAPQFAGSPQFSPGLGPQAHTARMPFGHDYQAQSPYAFGATMNGYLQNPFSANPYLQNPQLMQNPQFPTARSCKGPICITRSEPESQSGYAAADSGAAAGGRARAACPADFRSERPHPAAGHHAASALSAVACADSVSRRGPGVGEAGRCSRHRTASGPRPFSAQNPFAGATRAAMAGSIRRPRDGGGNRSQTIQ